MLGVPEGCPLVGSCDGDPDIDCMLLVPIPVAEPEENAFARDASELLVAPLLIEDAFDGEALPNAELPDAPAFEPAPALPPGLPLALAPPSALPV